ncbi:MAG TPA: hypothetical protein EYO58_04980 [Flavobacteriales bacterium]|nr:hypothetical protein [Flavobacteriales bacterium]
MKPATAVQAQTPIATVRASVHWASYTQPFVAKPTCVQCRESRPAQPVVATNARTPTRARLRAAQIRTAWEAITATVVASAFRLIPPAATHAPNPACASATIAAMDFVAQVVSVARTLPTVQLTITITVWVMSTYTPPATTVCAQRKSCSAAMSAISVVTKVHATPPARWEAIVRRVMVAIRAARPVPQNKRLVNRVAATTRVRISAWEAFVVTVGSRPAAF